MKLSSLTPQDKIKLAAELHGYQFVTLPDGKVKFSRKGNYWSNEKSIEIVIIEDLLPYSTSYDAIIPLIQKLDSMQFIKFVSTLLPDEAVFADIHTLNKARILYYSPPSQLLDALLVATGKAEI